ncbi:MAG: nucleotidyltransferase family protein, partial [Caldilineales bacterium]|nr:nucleotidyltransferase family protein [Caldilineales bacterium]
DVLVRPANFPRLQTVLAQLGYSGKHTDPERGPGIVKHEWTYKTAGATPATAATSTANPYLFADDSFHLEPHTSLTESWFGLRLELGDDIWDRAVAWELEGVPALALHPADCLLHVAAHLIFHLLMGKPALIQLYDLRRLLEAFPDLAFDRPSAGHPGLYTRAQTTGASAHLYGALRLAQAAYAAPVPAAWLQRLAADLPPGQRSRAEALDLPSLWRLTQKAPLTTIGQRLRRGLNDRALAAGWARDRREAWRVWRSGVAFHRTDTAALLRRRLALALR